MFISQRLRKIGGYTVFVLSILFLLLHFIFVVFISESRCFNGE